VVGFTHFKYKLQARIFTAGEAPTSSHPDIEMGDMTITGQSKESKGQEGSGSGRFHSFQV
jgi:hypothetical protein